MILTNTKHNNFASRKNAMPTFITETLAKPNTQPIAIVHKSFLAASQYHRHELTSVKSNKNLMILPLIFDGHDWLAHQALLLGFTDALLGLVGLCTESLALIERTTKHLSFRLC